MADTSCSICLDVLKNPVSTPCGHLHCEECLQRAIERGADLIRAACPTCRAAFSVAQLDLRFVPPQFQPFVIPSVRRVYFNASIASQQSDTTSALEERITELQEDKCLLMDRCEAAMLASSSHATRERETRLQNESLKQEVQRMAQEMEMLRKKYESLKGKYKVVRQRLQNEPKLGSPAKLTLPHPVSSSLKRTRSQAFDQASSSSSTSLSHTSSISSVSSSSTLCDNDSNHNSGPSATYTKDPSDPSDTSALKRPRLLHSPFKPHPPSAPSSKTRLRVQEKIRQWEVGSSRTNASRPQGHNGSALLDFAAREPKRPRFSPPRRSGLSSGDLFSPSRPRTFHGGCGSIDYSADTVGAELQGLDSEGEFMEKLRPTTFIFKGKKMTTGPMSTFDADD